MKIVLVAPCYKRPRIAQRLLQSVTDRGLDIAQAVIWLQPPHIPVIMQSYAFPVDWQRAPQRQANLSRTAVVTYAIQTYQPDIIWLTDDDVIATEYTVLNQAMLDLLQKPETGLVAITRQMSETPKPVAEHLVEPLPYIGGGYLFRPDVFKKVGGLPADAADEKSFGLAIYLAGYTNYRTRYSYAIHEQGGRSTGGGFLAQFKDAQHDASIDLPPSTQFGPNHPYLQLEPEVLIYAGIDHGILSSGRQYRLTDAAKQLHAMNQAILCKCT